MSQVKKSSNKIVIALAVICVILIASLTGIFVIYQPTNLQSQLAEKDQTIASLQAQLEALQEQMSQTGNSTLTYVQQIAYLNEQLANINATATDLGQQLVSANDILALRKSGILYSQNSISQDANAATPLWNDVLDYAGYVVVQAEATASTSYAQVIFTFGDSGVFNYNVTIGNSGTALLPVLPGTVQINICNILPAGATNNFNATATYYY